MAAYDVIIAGGGIIGLCAAWQLRNSSNLSVAVLEKGADVGEGSTGASSAVCRYRYSLDDMVHLARDGISAYRNWGDFTRLASPRGKFTSTGALWLTGDTTGWADTEHARMAAMGLSTEVLDDQQLAQRFPALSTCVVAPDCEEGREHQCRGNGRHFFEVEAGFMDPVDCAQDLRDACRNAGVAVHFNTDIDAILSAGGRVTGVRLADGSQLEAPCVLNASGPWCNALNQSAGLDLPWSLSPSRIQVVYLDCPVQLQGEIPLAVDMAGGIYFRPQNRGQQILLGSVRAEDEEESIANPDDFQREPDDDFRQRVVHALHHRLPGLPYRGQLRGYCGLYTINREDVHPIVGPTALEGYYVANGMSGHGFKLAPAIGAMLAHMIAGGRCEFGTTVDPALFAVDRAPISLETRSVLA